MLRLELVRNDSHYLDIRKEIVKRAERYASMTPLVITQKKKTLAPDHHYYFSISPYWWYDKNGKKYIRKDGERNPKNEEYDNQKLVQLSRRLKYLSVGYYLTGDSKLFDAYVRQVRVWFVDEATKMYPNFEYAKVIPGKNGNKGSSAGLIDGYCLNDVIESFRLVSSLRDAPLDIEKPLKTWFGDLGYWLIHSWNGKKTGQAVANSSISYDVILANISLFVGFKETYAQISSSFRKRRLLAQIAEDGRQPEELTRTKAYSYSIYNLGHILDYCVLQASQKIDFYGQNKTIIDKAFDYLLFFQDKETEWPYKQITSWKTEVIKLNSLSFRRNLLRGETTETSRSRLFNCGKVRLNDFENDIINKVIH